MIETKEDMEKEFNRLFVEQGKLGYQMSEIQANMRFYAAKLQEMKAQEGSQVPSDAETKGETLQ